MPYWYALYTKPNAEARVARALHERGIEVFLPMVRKHRHHRWQAGPLFPCYLFTQVDLEQVGYSAVVWTPGLRRIVAFGDKPAVVPEEAIEMIRRRLAEIEGQGGLPAHDFKPGDEVHFKEGPLQGLCAIFEGPMGPAERVRVLIEFLGQVNRAEVPLAVLERAPSVEGKRQRPRRTRGRGRRIAVSGQA
ncbi:MAG: transcription termination/antitermination NusG family protein [Anaerolineae bacterium]|nr:transcription termination/antitermination NusG family protein [Anaerolineae bacterium]